MVVLQAYTNQSRVAIEAKYVFPLDDMAAVCGFEAFINGKHIIGQVCFNITGFSPSQACLEQCCTTLLSSAVKYDRVLPRPV